MPPQWGGLTVVTLSWSLRRVSCCCLKVVIRCVTSVFPFSPHPFHRTLVWDIIQTFSLPGGCGTLISHLNPTRFGDSSKTGGTGLLFLELFVLHGGKTTLLYTVTLETCGQGTCRTEHLLDSLTKWFAIPLCETGAPGFGWIPVLCPIFCHDPTWGTKQGNVSFLCFQLGPRDFFLSSCLTLSVDRWPCCMSAHLDEGDMSCKLCCCIFVTELW